MSPGSLGFDLDPDTSIDSLSIAQRQQLEIVRLLALDVKALILDEPTTGISAEQKDTLFKALRRLAHDEGLIVLLVSHKLEDVISLCDRVVVLRSGEDVGGMEMPDVDAVSADVIATTKVKLVELMFGQEMPPQQKPLVPIGNPVMRLGGIHVRDKRLDMRDIQARSLCRGGDRAGRVGWQRAGTSDACCLWIAPCA